MKRAFSSCFTLFLLASVMSLASCSSQGVDNFSQGVGRIGRGIADFSVRVAKGIESGFTSSDTVSQDSVPPQYNIESTQYAFAVIMFGLSGYFYFSKS